MAPFAEHPDGYIEYMEERIAELEAALLHIQEHATVMLRWAERDKRDPDAPMEEIMRAQGKADALRVVMSFLREVEIKVDAD